MRKPSVSVLLIAFASWACGGGDSSGTSTPPPPTTGTLMVSVSGLPAGASAQGSITGPAGFNASLTGTQLFQGLVPGLYTVTPSTVSNSGTTYISAAQNGNVVAGQTANVGVTYSRVDPFETVPIIVLKTTKPVIVADRIQQTIISYYPIQNGGGGTLTPVVSNANPASWVQLAVVGGNTLQATITATGLIPYSEDETKYVVAVTVSAPGATAVPVTLKFAKTFDSPAGMAATVVRFHQNSSNLAADPPPTAFAQITLLDARSNAPIPAKIDAVDPTNPSWLQAPSINGSGQLELRVKQDSSTRVPSGGLPSPGNALGSPIRIKLTAANGGTTCPAFSVPPDPTCQVFVYYTADPFPRLFLRPWGLQLTPANPTQSANIEVQNPSTPTDTPAILSDSCGAALTAPPTISNPPSGAKITVSGNFAALGADQTVRCKVLIRFHYITSDTTLAADTASLTVTLANPSANAITPSHRDLNIVAAAGVPAAQADTISLYNLGPNVVSVTAPTFTGTSAGGFAACPASLLVAPTLVGTSIGQGAIAFVAVRVNPAGQVAQTCSATLRLSSSTAGVVPQDIPVVVRLK